CDSGVGLKVLFDQLHQKPKKIMVLGAACSVVTQPMAKTSQYFDLLQLSYASASPALSIRSVYRNFFRIYPSETAINPARIGLLKRFGWKKIVLLYQTVELFSATATSLIQVAEENEIQVTATLGFSSDDDPYQALISIQKSETRIIVGGFYSSQGRKVFCRAYHLGLTGSAYVWIITGWLEENWWLDPLGEGVTVGNHHCNDSVMTKAVKGYFGMATLAISSRPQSTISGLTSSEWLQLFFKYLQRPGAYVGAIDFASFTYDSVWAIALTLNQSINPLSKINKTLEDIDYYDKEALSVFKDQMQALEFIGITGPVAFNQNGDRLGITTIKRQIGSKEVIFGLYDNKRETVNWNYSVAITWQTANNQTPVDSPRIIVVNASIAIPLFIGILSIDVIGMLMTIVFLVFNIKSRSIRIIKISSPNVNNIIAIGAISCYISVFFFGVNTQNINQHNGLLLASCWCRSWFLVIGYTLGFGALFAKTWRIHSIFARKSVKTKLIRDSRLYGIISAAVFVDISIMLAWGIIDPVNIETKNESVPDFSHNRDRIMIISIKQCHSKYPIVWNVLLFGFNGLLLVYGAILAWQTRQVKMMAVNDSKLIGLAIYNVAIFASIGAGIASLVYDKPDAFFGLISVFIIFPTTVTVCLVFVPKVA
ncbi:uncharacterized protein TRIADDRAFT_18816, partial [Trichoplax adhaerens]